MEGKRFIDKIVIVTGATSGMGEATARLFAEEGATVALVGRNLERGRKIEEDINKAGGKALFIQCDVTDEQQVIKLKDIISKKYGKLDVLFNNAGILITGGLEEINTDDWDKTFATNVRATMYMTKHFIDFLEKSKGNIVNNASIDGLDCRTTGKKSYMYASAKAADIKFTKLCALNYAKSVRVNCLCPGITETGLFTNRDFSRFDGKIPMGYIARPIDIAKAVLFLASDDAGYITGATLTVDGGMSLMPQ